MKTRRNRGATVTNVKKDCSSCVVHGVHGTHQGGREVWPTSTYESTVGLVLLCRSLPDGVLKTTKPLNRDPDYDAKR